MRKLLLALFLFPCYAFGQTVNGYSFAKYPAISNYKGPKAKINLKSHPDASMFRTSIRNAYKDAEPEFAGYYVLAYHGCGTGCTMGYMIDVRDGRIYRLPETESNANNYCGDNDPIPRSMVNSRLYVMAACSFYHPEQKPTYTIFEWDEKHKKFVFLSGTKD